MLSGAKMRELTTDKMPELTTDYKRVRTYSYMPLRGERAGRMRASADV